jgi:small GTP-binding protein
MIQKKVCMIGTFAVGKTSLVRQFVESVYSDKYHTTVGVKVDKKIVTVGENEVTLVLWDIEGAETGLELRQSYLRGAAGYLLVADGTRPDTLASAVALQARAEATVGKIPFLLLLNKVDLDQQWRVDSGELDRLRASNWLMTNTSAKTGQGVEKAFTTLAQKMMGN